MEVLLGKDPMVMTPGCFFLRTPHPKIFNTILENVGRTPLVRINKIAKEEGLKCELCK